MRIIFFKTMIVVMMAGFQIGCVGKIVGAAVDTTIEVAKVPFKVAGAAVDVVAGDGKKDKDEKDNSDDE